MTRFYVCAIPGCYNVLGMRGTDFFCVPRSGERRQKWIEFIGHGERIAQNTRVCSKHFAPGEFVGLGQLKKTAIPTIRAPCSVTKQASSQEKSSPVNVVGNEESPTHSSESSQEKSSPVNVTGNGESPTYSSDDGCIQAVTRQEIDESGVIDTVKQEICRVCGCKNDNLVSIFENSSLENTYNIPLVKMLEMYLPLKLQDDDKLPSKICTKCSCMVNEWHELYITCVAADKTFQNMFCGGNFEGGHREPVGRLVKEVAHFTICDESSMEDYLVLKMKENVHENRNLQGSDKSVSDKCNYSKDKTIKISGAEKLEYPALQRYNYPQKLCHYCGDMFDDRSSWRHHNTACKESLTICEKCGKTVHKKDLKRHKYRYHSTKLLCDQCGERFIPCHLPAHLLTHNSETHYCNLCWKIFKSQIGYQQHLLRHEIGEIKTAYKMKTLQKEDKVVFVCPVCNLNFDDEHSLIIHLNQPQLVKCYECRLKLNNEKLLYLHKCKKFTCQHCFRSFHSKPILMGHMRIHTGETPYKCNFCDLSFRTSSVRCAHQIKAHSKPTLKCAYCPKKYYVPSRLRYHMNIHEGIRYKCPLCDKPFKRRETMKRHIKIHKKS